jgi:penicillin-binding protein 2
VNEDFYASKEQGQEYYPWELLFLKSLVVCVFVVLLLRLWFLQIAKGDEYLEKSRSNHISQFELPSVRGLILDRENRSLVENEVVFELTVTPKEVKNQDDLLERVANLTNKSKESLAEKLKAFEKSKPYSPSVWVTGLNRADVSRVESQGHRLPGLAVRANSVRRPIQGDFAPHLIGYIGQISKAQLESNDYPGLRQGDLVGQAGLEQSMESFLQGQKGSWMVTVDSNGRILEELQQVSPKPGHNVRLTIDSRLQRVSQALLAEQAGAIVVMDPRNFEILAMASSPMFNLFDFVGGISTERWRALNDDPFTPMQNRAVGGQYPPGSTFKIAVALTALSEGVVVPETEFNCAGALLLGNVPFHCWLKTGHGRINLFNALKYSCDVYFYELGRRMGIERLSTGVREYFGLGRPLGVELKSEQGGLVPDPAWKMRRFKRPWTQGDMLHVAIGQGYMLSTPLQVAQYTAVVANGGTLYRPHLVKEIVDYEGKIVYNAKPEVINKLSLKPEHLRTIQKGLVAVVNEPGGTGRRAALTKVKVAGKTGTSQTVSLDKYKGYTSANRPYKLRDHAWFTAYAPADKPEVVVAVILEHAGGGGTTSAPVAAKMLEAYFNPVIDTNLMPPYQAQPNEPTGWKGDL